MLTKVTCTHCFQEHEIDKLLVYQVKSFERYLTEEARALYNTTIPMALNEGQTSIQVCSVCDKPLTGTVTVKLLEDQLSQAELKRYSKEWNKRQTAVKGGDEKLLVATGSLSNNGVELIGERKAHFVQSEREPHPFCEGAAAVTVPCVMFSVVFEKPLNVAMVEYGTEDDEHGVPETYIIAIANAFNHLVSKGMLSYGIGNKLTVFPFALADFADRRGVCLVAFSKFTAAQLNEEIGGTYFVPEGHVGSRDWAPLLARINALPYYKGNVEDINNARYEQAQEEARGAPSKPIAGRE